MINEEYQSKYDANGAELMDSTPISASLRVRPQSEYQRMRALIRQELSMEAAANGLESWEEANDFDVGDDFDPSTPYEEQFDPDTGVSNWEFQEETPKGGDGGQDPHASPTPPIDNPPGNDSIESD